MWTGPASIKRTLCNECARRARVAAMHAEDEHRARCTEQRQARTIASVSKRQQSDVADWLAQDVH